MAQRATLKRSISRVSIPLANAVQAEKGQAAFIQTTSGEATVGSTSTTLVPIGYFDEDLLGDGTLEVKIRLFREVILHFFNNDTGTAIVAADILQDCFFVDSETVSADNTGRSVAGRTWIVSSEDGIGVEIVGFAAG